MIDPKELKQWEEAVEKFAQFSDGFYVMAYTNQGKHRLAKGRTEDPALLDALLIVENTAVKWADPTGGETEEKR